VKIQLPFAAPAAPRPAPASGHKPPARRVLYIDDDPRLRSVVAFQLRRLGQDVEVAEGGSDGLAKFRDGCYDVVITDLGMPEIDGGEVTRAVKAMRPGIPVIILTGWDSPSVRQNTGGGIEPDCILRKPPTLERLAEALEKRLASGSATKDSD
jgi:CheY-like chemotaxis protein